MLTASLVCLALNVYHEAKNQSFLGQVAVAQVVMNRVKANIATPKPILLINCDSM